MNKDLQKKFDKLMAEVNESEFGQGADYAYEVLGPHIEALEKENAELKQKLTAIAGKERKNGSDR